MFQDKGNYIILLEEERMRLQHTPIKNVRIYNSTGC